MTGPFADRLFRIAFALAGCYNLAFGLWATLWPAAFFEVFDVPSPRYPGIWACLGMVVGVYGLLYWHAAWNLATAWPIIAVGLLGKVLGPIGMALSFDNDWPRRLGMICVYNDVLWWLPFGLFLVRGTALASPLVALAPRITAALHAGALLIMALVLRGGTLAEPDALRRAAHIAVNDWAWSAGWGVWMLAAMSIVAFYAWWGSRLAARGVALLAVMLAAAGLTCDLSGEALSVLVLTERAEVITAAAAPDPADLEGFLRVERAATLLTAGAANALYTLGGLVLMLATPDLLPSVRAAMGMTWLAGLLMTTAAVADHVGGMVLSTAVLFPLLIAWIVWMDRRWRQP